MERIEPIFVPEWSRGAATVTWGGNSAPHFAASSLHSDSISSTHSTRNKSYSSINDKDSPRPALLSQISSSNSTYSSSDNGSSKHPYSSFARNHRDKKHDKGKEGPITCHIWGHDSLDPSKSVLISRVEKENLMRTHSMVSRKPSEVLPQRAVDIKNGGTNKHKDSNGGLIGGSLFSGIQKALFEKDFPSLGSEEKQVLPGLDRVHSPVLSMAVQSLPIGNSGFISDEGWTSALAEVPNMIGSSTTGTSMVQQTVVATSSSGASGAMAGLNMAEALSQAPSRARTTPQLPDKTQRLEELAIKQSRQLIPMRPSMPKASVVSSSDKSKPKTAARTNETISTTKGSQQQQLHSSQFSFQSFRGGQVRADTPKISHAGKFLVLKPVRENGVSSMVKDLPSPTSNTSRVATGQLAAAPLAPSAPVRSLNNPKFSTVEHKAAASALNPIPSVEKKPSMSQAQSRSDFFNLMRQKTSTNTSAMVLDSGAAVLSPIVEKSVVVKEVRSPTSPCLIENRTEVAGRGDTSNEVQSFPDVGEKNSFLDEAVNPDEEEAAFLRSLGWEEDGGEDEGLTEEEINAFYQEYMKLRPSLKVCRGLQPKLSALSHALG